MVRTGRLVYVHLPKTAGTYACAVLEDQLGAKPFAGLGGHFPARAAAPEHVEGRTVFGSLREPCDWYTSLYIHVMNNDEAGRANLRAYGNGSVAFRDVVYGMTHPNEVHTAPDAVGAVWRPYAGAWDDFRAAGCGLLSWAAQHMFQDAAGRWLVDCLIDGSQPDAGLAIVAGTVPQAPKNTRAHRGAGRFSGPKRYADWWTDDMHGWVREADAFVYDLMGYTTPHRPADAPVCWLGSAAEVAA